MAVRYRSLGVLRRANAVLTRVSDPGLLARLFLRRPFAHYGVEASPHAGSVLLVARTDSNRLLDWFEIPSLGTPSK